VLLSTELESVERERMRMRNRLRIYLQPADEQDEDGHCRGFGISTDEPAIRIVEETAQQLEALEKALVRGLEKQMRRHPLYAWAKSIVGVGEKTLARLLGAIGDPYIRPESVDAKTEEVRPGGIRKPSELWAYCGLHGSAGKKEKGKRANWNDAAKMRAFLVIESCIKQNGGVDSKGRVRPMSPYRVAYDAARLKYDDKLHSEECKRCGGKGKPAPLGSPWRDGHKHMGAVRIAMKALVLDLWREAKTIHERGAAPY
jgi:hypothetical protein